MAWTVATVEDTIAEDEDMVIQDGQSTAAVFAELCLYQARFKMVPHVPIVHQCLPLAGPI